MWLQLMCCALSNFPLSQFMRGQIETVNRRDIKYEKETIEPELIFKLAKVHEVLQFIYLRMWWSPGTSEFQVIQIVAADIDGVIVNSVVVNHIGVRVCRHRVSP
jgi:hypothetical protein